MKRFKVDEYKVTEKGKTYSIIVFPFIKYMWAYDNWVEGDGYKVDGPIEAYEMLRYAMAILIEASDKIIYFPCKQKGIGWFYNENHNLILCTPKAQLRRSLWIKLRRKLKYSQKYSYVLQYDREKLDDYCKNFLLKDKSRRDGRFYYPIPEIEKKIKNEHIEDLVGENLFMFIGKEECYIHHHQISLDIDEYDPNNLYSTWSSIGWIITESGLRDLEEVTKKKN